MRKLINSLGTLFWLAAALVLPLEKLDAAYAPEVTMTITAPDGQTQDLTVLESSLGVFKLKTGTEYGFRPTMLDDKGSRVIVTIFDMNLSPVELGRVEAGVAKPAAPSKTTPAFTIRVTKVNPKPS